MLLGAQEMRRILSVPSLALMARSLAGGAYFFSAPPAFFFSPLRSGLALLGVSAFPISVALQSADGPHKPA
jgi:hypothetical protein